LPVQSYPIANNTIFNMSTAHPDTHFTAEPTSTWTSSNGSKADLLDTFKTFCPRVQKLLNLVPEGNVLEWRLRVHLPLKTWVDGNVCLTGDAAHSTLPHLAQGAAQAAEDAAVLAVVLSRISKKEDIPKALKVYEVSALRYHPPEIPNSFLPPDHAQIPRRIRRLTSPRQRQGPAAVRRGRPGSAKPKVQERRPEGRRESRQAG
jgi:hypothetical protein